MADGLFGPSPWEIQQAQQQGLRQQAAAYAKQSPMERAAAGMYQAGGMLGGMGAEALGMKNVAVENARRTEQIMGEGDTDLGTSAGMAAKAEQFRKAGDLRTATALTMKANEMKRQEAAAVLAGRKQDTLDAAQLSLTKLQTAQAEKALRENPNLKEIEVGVAGKPDYRQKMIIDSRDPNTKPVLVGEPYQIAAGVRVDARSSGGSGGFGGATTGAGKPLTPIQVAKQDKMKAESSAAIRAQDNDIVTLGADIDKVANDPNLSKATGMSDYIPSRPGGAASQIEGQLDSIVNKLKAQGLKVLREGGGIGAITEKEWDILANQVANIDRKKGDVYVKGELEKVKLRMAEMKRNAAQRHAEQFGEEYVPSRDTPPAAGGGMPTPDAIAAEIARRRKGGK